MLIVITSIYFKKKQAEEENTYPCCLFSFHFIQTWNNKTPGVVQEKGDNGEKR